MKIYEVVTKFYDNGNVKAVINVLDLDSKPDDKCTETKTCDIYYDYFTDEKSARKHYNDAKLA